MKKTTDHLQHYCKIGRQPLYGSAKVNPDLAKNPAGNERLFFHADADQRLEGGFFGDNGEELAGRFISNDNSVFGVFAGKKQRQQTQQIQNLPCRPENTPKSWIL